MKQLQFSTPLGPLVVTANAKGIESVLFRDISEAPDHSNDMLLLDCKAQFEAYFNGSLQQFDLPLAAIGTDFQQAVWQQLSKIPFAELRSYSNIAHALNNPQAVRAVGAANGRKRKIPQIRHGCREDGQKTDPPDGGFFGWLRSLWHVHGFLSLRPCQSRRSYLCAGIQGGSDS